MNNSSRNTFVYCKPRHIRYIYLVESTISTELLLDIMKTNQQYWGGSYNPIIPIYNNVIPENYIELIKHCDPDYVLYSKGINLDEIKKLINAKNYIELNKVTLDNITGLDSTYLLEPNSSEKLLYQTGYLYKSLIKDILPFYELNFGFNISVSSEYEHEVLHKFDKILVNDGNIKNINKILATHSILYKSLLSKRHVTNSNFTTDQDLETRVELIISNEENQFEDLIYYWNRQLFLPSTYWTLRQVYITTFQLERLYNSHEFHMLLANISGTSDIKIVSLSIDKKELELIIKEKLNTDLRCVDFFIGDKPLFPYRITGFNPPDRLDEEIQEKLFLRNREGVIKIPKPSFVKYKNLPNQQWAVDIEIEETVKGLTIRKKHKIPLTTQLTRLYCNHNGRVNKEHDISLFIDNEDNYVEFKVPPEDELLRSLIWGQQVRGEYVANPIRSVQFSEAGKRLSAFIKLFDDDFDKLEDYISDKFWVQLFMYDSDYRSNGSGIYKGKGVFSYYDLINEIDLIYKKHEGNNEKRKEDEVVLKQQLQYLISQEGIYIGTKVKCDNCGGNKWYSFAELDTKIKCKGCRNTIVPKAETPLYYKLSEIITGNILSDTTKNSKKPDGNYIVLNALIALYHKSTNGFYSMLYCPSLDYITKDGKLSDIDIVAIVDGKLILGEAKNNAKEFNNMELNNLAWLANNIDVDFVMLAFNEGNIDEKKLNNLRGLIKSKCKVTTLKVGRPNYYSLLGVYGKPNINN